MAVERFILTRQGYEDIKQELAALEEEQQERLNQMADVNNDMGEIVNEEAALFEVQTMKEHVDERIGHLRLVLDHAEVIDEDPDPHRVDPGDRVTVWDLETLEERVFDLIGSTEATYIRRGVSIESPVGQALLGKKVGEIVEVAVPEGRARYAVRAITPIPEEDEE